MEVLFSIIVPIYNAERYLRECLDSLKNQTYRNIEIILVNDGSKDSSKQICEEYLKDERFRMIDKENAGVSNARNDGIRAASGTYIIFVDSDDSVSLNMCQEYADIIKREDIDLIISNGEFYDDQGLFIRSFSGALNEGLVTKNILKERLNETYIKGILNVPWSKCFKKNRITNLFDSKISLGEDLLFNLSYLKGCKEFYYLDKPLYKYIVFKQASLSTKYREDGFKTINYVYNKTISLLNEMLGNDGLILDSIHDKYMLDCLVTLERIARNTSFSKEDKFAKIKENAECYLKENNLKLRAGKKWKIYLFLLKHRLYKLFVFFSNLIRRK